jgi:hypothetical protein
MTMKRWTLVLLACLPLLTGCLDIEQTLTLDKNLAGKSGMSFKIDMEPFVLFMVRMQKEMSGQEGEPTAAEIEEAKKQFLASSKKEEMTGGDPEARKAEIEKSLPAGVKLLDSSIKEDGLKLAANFLFGFDNVAKLSEVKLSGKKPDEPAEGPQPPGSDAISDPFDNLVVKDEGKTVLITTKAINPMDEQEAEAKDAGLPPEMQEEIKKAFEGLRFAFKLDTPMEVVEHNATRREGKTLIWEYNLESFEKMTAEQKAEGIRVRLKK